MKWRLAAALVAVALLAPTHEVQADRLGGNYRGPLDDIYTVREDANVETAEGTGETSGSEQPTSGGTAPESGGGEPGGEGGGGEPGGGGEGGGGEGGGGEGGGGEGGGGEGGGEGSGEPDAGGEPGGGGGEGEGSSTGSTAPPPPSGGGGGGGSSEPGGSTGGPAPAGGGGSSGGFGKKSSSADDKDKIWPFYFEGAKEEYIRTVFERRLKTRIAPPRSSSFRLSTQPEPARKRQPAGETERKEAMALVQGLLKDKDSHVRDAAVIALGKSRFKEAVPLIVATAQNDADYQVREDALLALGLSGQTEAALPILLKALEGKSADRREKKAAYAALGLGLLGDAEGAGPALRQLYLRSTTGRHVMPDEAACAAVALGMLGDEDAIGIFAKAVVSRGAPDSVKAYTVHALGKYGENPNIDPKVRRKALAAILSAARDKKHKAVLRACMLALGSFDDKNALQTLLKRGLSDSDDYTRNFAAASLGRHAIRLGPSSREYRIIAAELSKRAENENKSRTLCQSSNLALASMAHGDHERHLMD
ncbi:MAG: HEAT repeat domain-containing protein, partial [Planctomycetota bacterium]